MNRKLFLSISILALSILGELFLWNKVVLFSVLLITLAYIKHLLYPIKKEFQWYILICVIGTFIEIVLINYGHGWTYSNPNVFGIPIWIPLFWGLIGTTILVIYDGFKK